MENEEDNFQVSNIERSSTTHPWLVFRKGLEPRVEGVCDDDCREGVVLLQIQDFFLLRGAHVSAQDVGQSDEIGKFLATQ